MQPETIIVPVPWGLLFCFMPTKCMNNSKLIELLKCQLKTRQINVVNNVATDSEYFGILKIMNLSLFKQTNVNFRIIIFQR